MIIRRIEGANVDLAKDQPEYRTLPVRVTFNGISMEWASAHEPTPDELDRLIKGAPIILTVLGLFKQGYPPMRLEVGEIPNEN